MLQQSEDGHIASSEFCNVLNCFKMFQNASKLCRQTLKLTIYTPTVKKKHRRPGFARPIWMTF